MFPGLSRENTSFPSPGKAGWGRAEGEQEASEREKIRAQKRGEMRVVGKREHSRERGMFPLMGKSRLPGAGTGDNQQVPSTSWAECEPSAIRL